MLTPVFSIEQDDKFIILTIEAPMAKIAETEIECESCEVYFSSPPYFLRIYLPAPITDEEHKAKYDCDSGSFTIHVHKVNEGQVFEGLNLLTKLMTPPSKIPNIKPLIETLSSETNEEEETEDGSEFLIEQKLPLPCIPSEFAYGFASSKNSVLEKLGDELYGLFTIPSPMSNSQEERRKECLNFDIQNFSEDHYLMDLFEKSDELKECLEFSPDWKELSQLNSEERGRLLDMATKCNYDWMTQSQIKEASITLVEYIFAFMYEYRTTLSEMNCESSWTLQTLCASLSCLSNCESIESSVDCVARRCVVYPLYRHWHLVQTVFNDVKRVFKLGSTSVLKILLGMHKTFATGCQMRYVLNELFIKDYCLWIQTLKEDAWEKLVTEVKNVKLSKERLGLDLENIELAANLSMMELENVDSDDDENVVDNNDVLANIARNI